MTQTLKFETPDQGQETARADLYGLLATLFYAPPKEELLASLRAVMLKNELGNAPLEQAWRSLAACALPLHQAQVQAEYETLFMGVGKAEVFLFASFYLTGFLMEKPLVILRNDLNALGLQKADAISESEDHISALCEVMRYLIASDDVEVANLHHQQSFFRKHIQSWFADLCDVICQHPQARFYAQVAQLMRCFFEVETQAFDLL